MKDIFDFLTRASPLSQYVRAAEEYVGSLRAAGPNWHWSTNEIDTNNLSNMMIFYEIAHRAVDTGLHRDSAHQTIEQAFLVALSLLSMAGFHCDGCTLFNMPLVLDVCKRDIKKEYKVAKKAWKAFVAATFTPTIDDYHSKLLSYRKEVIILRTDTCGTAAEREQLVKNEKAKSKGGARETQQGEDGPVPTSMWSCSNCLLKQTNILYCQCKMARYCSKDCQLRHFPQHKKDCPHVLAKRKQKSK